MRWLLSLAASLVVAALPVSAVADDTRDCLDHKDQDVRIKSCSENIRRDAKNAIAYYNRGTAHQLKGDLDRATADYSKAIELKPNYASAYNSRGLVYASKGDYAHAVADVTKASELTPKTTPRPKVKPPAGGKQKAIAKARARANENVVDEEPLDKPNWVPSWSESQ